MSLSVSVPACSHGNDEGTFPAAAISAGGGGAPEPGTLSLLIHYQTSQESPANDEMGEQHREEPPTGHLPDL